MSSSPLPRSSDPRSGRAADPLEARVVAALRPPARPGLGDRIADASMPILRREAAADARVRRGLARTLAATAPAGLACRVHAASARVLRPAAALEAERAAAPAWVLGYARRARTLSGRLAMAASLGVLAVLGWWAARPAPVEPGPVPVDRLLAVETTPVLDVSWASLDDVVAMESELTLLEDWDVGSYADVEDEIAAMIPDFLLADSGR